VSEFSLVVVAIPVIGALLIAIAALRSRSPLDAAVYRRIAGIFALCALAAVVCLSLFGWFQRVKTGLGGNDCSAAFALLTAAVWLPVIYVARRAEATRPARLYGMLLLLEASYLAIFACDHALWLCASLQINSVLVYFVTVGWGDPASEGPARKMLWMNLAADLAILVGLLGVAIASARVSGTEPNTLPRLTYSLAEITRDFPEKTTKDEAALEYWKHAQRTLLVVLIVGTVIKAPLVPFHAWLAGVVSQGPLCVGLALLGPGLRVSLYLLARFIGPLYGDLGWGGDLLSGLAVLGALHASLLTYGQSNFKKMIAAVALLQGSLSLAAFFAMRSQNASGPLMLSLACGVATPLVLFALGFLELRAGTADFSEVGGLIHKLPNLAIVLLFGAFSLVGIPGLFGFPGLFSTLGAIFSTEWTLAFLAVGACLIAAWALFSMLQHLVFGSPRLPVPADADVLLDGESPPPPPGAAAAGLNDPPGPGWASDAAQREWSIVNEGKSGSLDLGLRELLILGPLLVALLTFGFWPRLISAVLRFALAGSSLFLQ
jgi:NADH-quinone oxidoreductase subunit M